MFVFLSLAYFGQSILTIISLFSRFKYFFKNLIVLLLISTQFIIIFVFLLSDSSAILPDVFILLLIFSKLIFLFFNLLYSSKVILFFVFLLIIFLLTSFKVFCFSGIIQIFSNTFIFNQYFFNSCLKFIASSLSSILEKILILKFSLNKLGELNTISEYLCNSS